jgi:hypothetical protein
MKKLRARLTYANVMATIAVFIALGGASYAATQLPKNSVGTKQLRNNAVTGAKIKKGAVTGAKIKLSTLGTVPSATNATNATNAANASQLGGRSPSAYASTQLEPVHYVGALGEPTFESGCENYDPKSREPIGFYKDPFGIVHLVGRGKGCSFAESVFTLPSGFRPANGQLFTNQTEEIQVGPTGQVICYLSAAPVLDGITFRAAQ